MHSPEPLGPAALEGLPKLRDDLILRQHDTASGAGLVVKDPVARRYFRFKEAEAFVLRHLDGRTTLGDLRLAAEEHFAASLPAPVLAGFVQRLQQTGLLEAGPAGSRAPAPGGRIRGSPLYLRFRAFDPDRLLSHMVQWLGPLFTPGFVVLSSLCVVSAIAVSLAHRPEIARGVIALYGVPSLLLALMTIYGVIVVHEFAHGLACKRFGGTVTEMGFLLIYLQPAFYCNVSDAWLFPEKSRRLWVTFAGAYVEIVLWALATLVWRLTESGTLPSRIALIVMATSLIKTLINLNPLIRLDGYYMLSDYLEIPNLRRRASEYMRALVRRLGGVGAPDGPRPTRREARVFLLYGLFAGAYSAWLLGYMGLWLGRYLVTRYQAWGFILFTGLLLAVFHAPVGRTPDRLPTGPGSMRAIRSAWLRWAKVLVCAAFILAILWFAKWELKVSGEFDILPAHNADVRTDVEGTIEEVRVDEGDQVAKGDVIARLAARDYRAEIEKVVAQIEENQARLRMLRGGARPEELALTRTSVEKARERLKYANDKLAMLSNLMHQSLVSQKDFGDAQEEVAVRQKELEEAEGRLRMLQAGSRPEEIESVEAEIRRWDANRRYLEGQLERLNIVSPISGIVTTPKLRERVGERLGKGDLVAKVHELTTVTAEIAVPEREISDVQVGQVVELRARSYPGRTFRGEVTSIATTASQKETDLAGRTIVVTTRLENPSLLLKPEMTGTAKIHCGRARLVSLLTRRLSHTLRVELWSWW